jgi:hypothetical protein
VERIGGDASRDVIGDFETAKSDFEGSEKDKLPTLSVFLLAVVAHETLVSRQQADFSKLDRVDPQWPARSSRRLDNESLAGLGASSVGVGRGAW